jgi:hypothetical protein
MTIRRWFAPRSSCCPAKGRNGIAAAIWASRTAIAPRAGVVTANLHM